MTCPQLSDTFLFKLALMARMEPVTTRLSGLQREQLKRLVSKLGMKKSDIMRLALTALAEREGVKVRPTWDGSKQS